MATLSDGKDVKGGGKDVKGGGKDVKGGGKGDAPAVAS